MQRYTEMFSTASSAREGRREKARIIKGKLALFTAFCLNSERTPATPNKIFNFVSFSQAWSKKKCLIKYSSLTLLLSSYRVRRKSSHLEKMKEICFTAKSHLINTNFKISRLQWVHIFRLHSFITGAMFCSVVAPANVYSRKSCGNLMLLGFK